MDRVVLLGESAGASLIQVITSLCKQICTPVGTGAPCAQPRKQHREPGGAGEGEAGPHTTCWLGSSPINKHTHTLRRTRWAAGGRQRRAAPGGQRVSSTKHGEMPRESPEEPPAKGAPGTPGSRLLCGARAGLGQPRSPQAAMSVQSGGENVP